MFVDEEYSCVIVYNLYICTHTCKFVFHSYTVLLAVQNLIAHTDAEHIPEVLFHLLLHETSHALGFSQSQFRK